MIKSNKKQLNLSTRKFKLPTGIYKNDIRNVFNYFISDNRLDKLKRSAN